MKNALEKQPTVEHPTLSAGLVIGCYGIDTSTHSFPYVAMSAKDKTVLRRNLAKSQGVAGSRSGVNSRD